MKIGKDDLIQNQDAREGHRFLMNMLDSKKRCQDIMKSFCFSICIGSNLASNNTFSRLPYITLNDCTPYNTRGQGQTRKSIKRRLKRNT